MLEYEWGNPSVVMLTGDEQEQQNCNNQSRQFFDSYDQPLSGDGIHHFLSHPATAGSTAFSHHQFQTQSDIHNIYDLESSYPQPPPFAAISAIGGDSSNGGYLMIPKSEEIGRQSDYSARIGLNLGHRTYFSSDDDFVNRLYRRSRPGPLDTNSINTPRCQAEGCTADLTNAKHYHRRHKVCEFHSKVSTVIAGGLTQRFCQQCSRFHLLTEFDNGKRSCRKRLADHNRRRRKSQHQPVQSNQNHQTETLGKSSGKMSSESLRSLPECGNQPSSSSVTVALSPPRMTLDCFRQKSYNGMVSSASSNLIFYGNE